MIYIWLCFFGILTSCRFTTDVNVAQEQKIDVSTKDTFTISLAYITGQFEPSKHPDFTEIPIQYADQKGRFIRKDVLEAFKKMYDKAASDGVHLIIKSATRNFDAQKKIWEDKWLGRRNLDNGINAKKDIKNEEKRALKILEYSSMPGTSRHHWGTDIDLNAFNNAYFDKGEGLKMYVWLQKHASDYGFCQTYTTFDDNRTTGYQAEKWHWSYTPVSIPLTEWAKQHLKDSMITGFAGCKTATKIGIVKNYILGIHPNCQTVSP
ncbi:MAG: M15 family metallopeptidase [Saprospiraceae bacterium]